MKAQRVSTGYTPRPLQLQIHRRLKRFSVLAAHRRFGKTVLCVNTLIDGAVRPSPKEDRRYAYIGPLLNQTKDLAWLYLKRYGLPIPGTNPNETELFIEFPNKSRVRLYGADNPDRLRGIYLDGVVLDEYAQMDPRLWSEVVRPALSDRLGWAIFIGTPKGKNAFWSMYDGAKNGFADPDSGNRLPRDVNWYAEMFKASETGIVPADELAAARIQMGEDHYNQEYECSFEAAIVGSYYGKLMAAAEAEKPARIGKVPWEPTIPVVTAWDLGIGDSTAIWFCQQVGKEVRLIDYYETSGVGLDHYAKVLGAKPYVYAEHLVPHDAEVGELGTGKKRTEVMASLGMKTRTVAKMPVDDGIQAARNLIPRCWFDAEKCQRGLEGLRQYRREWDEKLKAFRARPLHDWTSHGSDAFRYLAVGLKELDDGKPAEPYVPTTGDWMV